MVRRGSMRLACQCAARKRISTRRAVHVLMELGWGSEPTKEAGPRDRLDARGVDVDLEGGRMRLTAARRERYAAHAEERWRRVRCVIV